MLFSQLLLLLGGCGALFDNEYYVSAPYEVPSPVQEETDAAYDGIGNYASLRRALTQLVEDHVESAQLQFTGYDGDLSRDISTACWEVKSSTALGAFAVDYISYDLSRIVSYYQAELNIVYKRSAAQVSSLERTGTLSNLSARLTQALRQSETYLVLEISAASATAETVRSYITQAYFSDPTACPVLPVVDVGLYPETGVSRVAEISLNYSLERSELSARREALAAAIEEITNSLSRAPGRVRQSRALHALCLALTARCRVDANGGSTAWDALTSGTADSQGMALALTACAQALGLDCQVVSGRMANEAHCWNIVTLDGISYHVDVSRTDGEEPAVFLAGDEQLWGLYWWDASEYPACPGDFDAAAPTASTPIPLPPPLEPAPIWF